MKRVAASGGGGGGCRCDAEPADCPYPLRCLALLGTTNTHGVVPGLFVAGARLLVQRAGSRRDSTGSERLSVYQPRAVENLAKNRVQPLRSSGLSGGRGTLVSPRIPSAGTGVYRRFFLQTQCQPLLGHDGRAWRGSLVLPRGTAVDHHAVWRVAGAVVEEHQWARHRALSLVLVCLRLCVLFVFQHAITTLLTVWDHAVVAAARDALRGKS